MSILLSLALAASAALPGAESFLEGTDAQRAGRYAEARAAFDACAAQDGPLTPYARARSAACLEQSGRPEDALAAYQAVLEVYPEGPWVAMIYADMARVYQSLGRRHEAAACFAHVLDTEFQPWWLDRYRWLAIDNFLALPETAPAAYPLLREAIADGPARSRRFEAAERLAQSSDIEDLWAAATAMIRFNAGKAAEKTVNRLMLLADTPERRLQWNYLHGRVLLSKGQTATAIDRLREVVDEGGHSEWGRMARSHLARALFDAGRRAEAQAEFERMVEDWPGYTDTGDALWAYGARLKDVRLFDASAEAYLHLAKVCPDHDRADDAYLEAARILRDHGRIDEALAAYDALAARYPNSPLAPEGAYEAGRLREGRNDRKGAAESYGRAADIGFGNFYGHRALARLQDLGETRSCDGGALPIPGAGLRLGLIVTDPADEAPQGWKKEPLPSVVLLEFFGLHGLPEAEWEALHLARLKESGPGAEFLYRAMADAGLAYTAVQMINALSWGYEDGKPEPGRIRVMYPRAYWNEVRALAAENGLDPYLILAVARQESTFRPAVVSSAGATGVMQLMPATARWLAEVDPAVGPEHAARLDVPASSLRMGSRYLARMLRTNDGNPVYALAAYNGGPGNVRKWRSQRPGLDAEEFIESIPFSETREYVKRVLANYAAYRSLYK